MPELERELRELRVEWPDTPDLAAAVAVAAARGAGPGAARRRRWLDRPAWQLGVAVAAALIAVVMAVPPARSAVLEFLGLRSVKIERREPRSPSRFGSGLGARRSGDARAGASPRGLPGARAGGGRSAGRGLPVTSIRRPARASTSSTGRVRGCRARARPAPGCW